MDPTPNTTHIKNSLKILNPGEAQLTDDDDVTIVTSNVTKVPYYDQDQDQKQDLPRKVSFGSQVEPAGTVVNTIHPPIAIHQHESTTPTGRATSIWKQQINHTQFTGNISGYTKDSGRKVELAISDSGATGHFLVAGAPAVNVVPAKNPINILLPNGKRIQSTHTCNLDIPWLPAHITEAHIVPSLSHASLISTRKFCDAGCTVVFDEEECRVYHEDKLVLTGDRDPNTKLWRLPINPIINTHTNHQLNYLDLQLLPHQTNKHVACNVYTIPYKQNQLKYMHQSFFNAPIPTLLTAVAKGHLQGIPLMKADLINKHLAKSPATSKGRMKRPRAGIRSTRKLAKIKTVAPIDIKHAPINKERE